MEKIKKLSPQYNQEKNMAKNQETHSKDHGKEKQSLAESGISRLQ